MNEIDSLQKDDEEKLDVSSDEEIEQDGIYEEEK